MFKTFGMSHDDIWFQIGSDLLCTLKFQHQRIDSIDNIRNMKMAL